MAVTHANKALALDLVVQQVGVGNYQCLLTKVRHLHHSKLQVSINMGWSSLLKEHWQHC